MANKEYKIRNANYLYVLSGVSTQEQFQNSVMECFRKNGIVTDFKAVIVSNRRGLCGHGYLWVKDSEVFQMLAGEDKYGKCETAGKISNPNWKAPDIPYDKALDDLENNFDDDDYSTPWEKMAAISDAKLALSLLYEPDMIVIPTKCKLNLPPYKLTSGQKEHYRKQNEENNNPNAKVPEHVDYVVTSAYYGKDKVSMNQDVLMARRIPRWLTDQDIKGLFEAYVADITTKTKLTINKNLVEDTYPFVLIRTSNGRNRRPERSVYVYFDPKAGEGRMISLVCRKIIVCKKRNNGHVDTCNLIFNHPPTKE